MMQDSFSEFTGFAIITIDRNGKPVVKGSGDTDFCQRLTRQSEAGCKCCDECVNKAVEEAKKDGKTVFYRCHMGLTSFVIPIAFSGRHIGTIIAGQVNTGEVDIDSVRRKAHEFGIDPDLYADAAVRTNYVPRDFAERLCSFLEEFSKSLSLMAYSNFRKISKIRKTEQIAQSQAGFISGITENLRTSMRGWLDDFRAATMKYDGIDEITFETNALLSKGQEVYAVIDGAIEYIRMSRGTTEFAESVYDIRTLIENTVLPLRKEGEALGVSVTTDIDPRLPETFAGNPGRLGQIISKLGGNIIKYTKKGGSVTLHASSRKTTYACVLEIKITAENTLVTRESAEKCRQIIKGGGSDVLSEMKKSSSKDFELPLIVMLTKQMSGSLSLDDSDDGGMTFTVAIPQLDGSKKTA